MRTVRIKCFKRIFDAIKVRAFPKDSFGQNFLTSSFHGNHADGSCKINGIKMKESIKECRDTKWLIVILFGPFPNLLGLRPSQIARVQIIHIVPILLRISLITKLLH